MAISRTWKFYNYTPSLGAAIVYIILFMLATATLSYQVWYTSKVAARWSKNPFVTEEELDESDKKREIKMYSIKSASNAHIPFFIGCALEIVGYICRAKSAANTDKLTPFIIQNMFVLVAPTFFAATIYMIFGRILFLLDCQSLMPISPRYGTTFFVTGDVISFLLQGTGGGLMASSGGRNIGSYIVIIGLFVQVVFFGFFILMEIRFTMCVPKTCPYYWKISRKWWFLNLSLLVSSVLILIRSIVRIVEAIQGYDGYIMGHEWFLYIFDALPMFFVIVSFCVASYFGNIFDVTIECRGLKETPQEINAEFSGKEDIV